MFVSGACWMQRAHWVIVEFWICCWGHRISPLIGHLCEDMNNKKKKNKVVNWLTCGSSDSGFRCASSLYVFRLFSKLLEAGGKKEDASEYFNYWLVLSSKRRSEIITVLGGQVRSYLPRSFTASSKRFSSMAFWTCCVWEQKSGTGTLTSCFRKQRLGALSLIGLRW